MTFRLPVNWESELEVRPNSGFFGPFTGVMEEWFAKRVGPTEVPPSFSMMQSCGMGASHAAQQRFCASYGDKLVAMARVDFQGGYTDCCGLDSHCQDDRRDVEGSDDGSMFDVDLESSGAHLDDEDDCLEVHSEAASAYEVLFKAESVAGLREVLGSEPTVSDLLARPARDFCGVVRAGLGPTLVPLEGGRWLLDVSGEKGYPLARLAGLWRARGLPIQESWLGFATDPPELEPDLSARLVGLTRDRVLRFSEPGYCYLRLFPAGSRLRACLELRVYPTVAELLGYGMSPQRVFLDYRGEDRWHVSRENQYGGYSWDQFRLHVRESAMPSLEFLHDRRLVLGHRVGAAEGASGFDVACESAMPSLEVLDDRRLVSGHRVGAAESASGSDVARSYRILERMWRAVPERGDEAVYEELPVVVYDMRNGLEGDFQMVEVSGARGVARAGAGEDNLFFQFAEYGMLHAPAHSSLVIGGARFKFGCQGGIVLARWRFRARLELPGGEGFAFVRPLSRAEWRRWSSKFWLLPWRSSEFRMATMDDADCLVLAPGWLAPRARYKFAEVPASDEQEDQGRSKSSLRLDCDTFVYARVDRPYGTLWASAPASVMLRTDAQVTLSKDRAVSFANPVSGLGVVRVGARALLTFSGVSDRYMFDGGGPSPEDSCVSGEEY